MHWLHCFFMHHTIVWIDSKSARVFELAGEDVRHHVHHREEPEQHINPHTPRAGRYEERFFHAVAGRLSAQSALLILGPGVAKEQFVHYLRSHYAAIARVIVGVETADHPSDAQIVALGRKRFSQPHAMV